MFIIGISWLLFWLLIQVFTIEIVKAALITAIILIILALLVGEHPWENWTKHP